MGRTAAVIWHASFSIIAAGLYFFFVLPRWPELMGQTSPTLGTVLRLVTAALIGLAALPVVFTLLRTRKLEYRTPTLALTLRLWSIVLHVLAAVLIAGTAISEIWLPLDTAGRWLFGSYGAAAAIALLGMFAFYLAFVAELPPPPPKPLKVREQTNRRGRRMADETGSGADETPDATAKDTSPAAEPATAEEVDANAAEDAAEPTGADPAEVVVVSAPDDAAEADDGARADLDEAATDDDVTAMGTDVTDLTPEPNGRLRNRRPSGKAAPTKRRGRSRGGVAVDD